MAAWKNIGRISWIAVVVAILAALSGCASSPAPKPDTFPVQAAIETFTTGYSNISRKYIEPVLIGDLALEGVRGLGAIDPALTVSRLTKEVVLAATDIEIARFPVPAGDDAEAWAALTVDIARAGRSVSGELGRATVEDVYEAVFDSALSRLDRYSRYAGREEAKRNRARREGFGGLGIRFEVKNGDVRIIAVMDETPAEGAGLKPGDVIVQVDDKSVQGMGSQDVVRLLRGPLDTEVVLSVRRGGRLLTFELKRAHVVPDTVTERFDDGILILRISRFNQATSRSLQREIKKAERKHGNALRGVVLDLRGNPGGLLKQAIYVADLFLTQGEIVRTRGRHPDSLQYYEAAGADLALGLPLVVLVDGRSASSAEITAAALQDRGRGIVIGTTSFGKGTVQTVIRLPNDGEITLTWSRFITPSGYILHELGVHPTLCTSDSSPGSADPVAGLLSDRTEAAAIFSAWRTVSFTDGTRKRSLRATCPSERRRQSTELALARRLIDDSALYDRLLGFSNTAAAAAQP